MPDYGAKQSLEAAKAILESETRSKSLLRVLKEGSTSQDGIREILRQCGEERVAAAIMYNDIEGNGGHRHIDPYEWMVTGGNSGRRASEKVWAHCHEHNDTHSFIMARIFWAIKTDKPKVGPYPYLPRGLSRKAVANLKEQEQWQKDIQQLEQGTLPLGGSEAEDFDIGSFPGYRSEKD
jgi:hypothetical protein